jgi:hypothetical protein
MTRGGSRDDLDQLTSTFDSSPFLGGVMPRRPRFNGSGALSRYGLRGLPHAPANHRKQRAVPELSNQTIFPYSDLLLHDTGRRPSPTASGISKLRVRMAHVAALRGWGSRVSSRPNRRACRFGTPDRHASTGHSAKIPRMHASELPDADVRLAQRVQ